MTFSDLMTSERPVPNLRLTTMIINFSTPAQPGVAWVTTRSSEGKSRPRQDNAGLFWGVGGGGGGGGVAGTLMHKKNRTFAGQ